MKKYIIPLLSILGGAFFITSCLEDYLDKAPESGLTQADVFSKFENAKKYFDFVYNTNTDENGGVYYSSEVRITGKGSLDYDCVTDFCDAGRVMWWAYHKWGPLGDNNVHFGPMLPAFFKNIRRANMVLKYVKDEGSLNDGKEEDIADLIAQAYFIRGFCHFEVFRLWGAMPYITKPIGPDDQWDIPRLTARETMIKVAADMDTAVTWFEKAGKMRRDPLPGQVGHLNDPEQKKPNGCTAKAYKSRALLYGASPLNNPTGNVEDWKAAAVASWDAIKVCEQYGYDLLSPADYTKNYFGVMYTNEMLWGDYYGTIRYNNGWTKQPYNAIFCNTPTNNSGLCPTQGTVDLFETKWGDPLFTQADRDAATALGHYNEQDPFVNREPRFYIDIIYNGAPIPGYVTAKIYFEMVGGVQTWSELCNYTGYAGVTRTGYYMRKIWGGQSIKNDVTLMTTCPMIRLGELYLNYAEAANEGYGPTTPAPGATMTAVDAVNFIRNGGTSAGGHAVTRWPTDQLAPVQTRFTASKELLRDRVKNERKVELSFEGHYYYDIRRWKDAPVTMAGPLMGNMPEKVPVSAEYPTGYKYTRLPLSDDRQSRWFDAKYYLPFTSADYYKMKNFDAGQVW
jgi:hypothetical protein